MTNIYLVTNKINKKQYVGITKHSIELRWRNHTEKSSYCRKLKNSINKYGKENFTIEHIFTVLDNKDAREFEDFFIDYYNTLHPNGFNLMHSQYKGGVSEETKGLLSESSKRAWQNPETREKLVKDRRERWDSERKEKYAEIMKKRMANGEVDMSGRDKYVKEKSRSIVGINKNDLSIIKFDSVNKAKVVGFYPDGCLRGKDRYNNGYVWFFDEGHEDDHYINLAKEKLHNT